MIFASRERQVNGLTWLTLRTSQFFSKDGSIYQSSRLFATQPPG